MRSGQGLIAWFDCPAAENPAAEKPQKNAVLTPSAGVAARKKYRVTLLGEGPSLNHGTCGRNGAFVV